MSSETIKRLLAEGEGLTVEYKKCTDELSNSVFETVCSFSNRYGGYILLGVNDDGTVIGVNQNIVASLKKNFVNMLNNPQKISPTLFIYLEEAEIDGKIVLYAYIPVSSQVEFCSGRIFDRTEDADIDITKSTDLVAHLFKRKSSLFTEREIFPYAKEEDLRLDLIPRVKRMALSRYPDHPWEYMSNMELFKSAGLYEDDKRTGKKGFNLAGILLFGRDEVIRSCTPGYLTDAILRKEDLDRYDDRLMVETNLIDAYDRLVEFIGKHTKDKFFLIGDQNVSVRSWIAREVVSNILVHREYSSTFPAKIIIEEDCLYAENWNRSNMHGRIDPENFMPQPKNPLLARFFVNIGRADQLGSGVRNLYKYTKIYSGGVPELIEGDVFKTIIPLSQDYHKSRKTNNAPVNVPENVSVNAPVIASDSVSVSETAKKIYMLIMDEPGISYDALAEKLSKNRTTIRRNIKALKDAGLLKRVGSDKAGYWEIVR